MSAEYNPSILCGREGCTRPLYFKWSVEGSDGKRYHKECVPEQEVSARIYSGQVTCAAGCGSPLFAEHAIYRGGEYFHRRCAVATPVRTTPTGRATPAPESQESQRTERPVEVAQGFPRLRKGATQSEMRAWKRQHRLWRAQRGIHTHWGSKRWRSRHPEASRAHRRRSA